MFRNRPKNPRDDSTQHLLSENLELTDRNSGADADEDIAQGLAASSHAPGAPKWLRRLKGVDESKETAFAGALVDSEGSRKSQAGEESDETDDVDSVENSLQKYYAPIDSYEGKHRYDPKARWTPEEERNLVRRLDWRICSWCCLMFFALQLDRGNIVQALSDNMLDDLGLTTNDYNTGQTIFFLTFLTAELPSQLVSKKLGPDNWSMAAIGFVAGRSDAL